jgi:hypothetical protein
MTGMHFEIREKGSGTTVRFFETKEDGRFALTVPVGTKYYIMVDAGPMVGKMIADDVEPETGAIDLGDVRL